MSTFKDRVNSSINNDFLMGEVVHQQYDVTGTGQEVAFVVTKVIWYALRIYFDESHTKGSLRPYHITEHLTLSRAKDKIIKYLHQLSNKKPYFVCPWHESIEEKVCLDCVEYFKLPTECSDNPDNFLKPGDHISVDRGIYCHDAIYGGNRLVYQISGDGNLKTAKATTCARMEPWEKFTLNKQQTIYVIVYRIRRRTQQDIINAAKTFCNLLYGSSEYNLFAKNCQHFAGKCCTGFEWSTQATKSRLSLRTYDL